eukprot:TRINITY_DN3886_c0_g1_i1.p1 TRINITY_DN3886_c0_g1~~TRINITY_DN3886_c0_g1_i1.p1  ORF type:complete len:267 (-),score=52.76 TRINITY_DN3886_c0_g1_i1:62-862(-)
MARLNAQKKYNPLKNSSLTRRWKVEVRRDLIDGCRAAPPRLEDCIINFTLATPRSTPAARVSTFSAPKASDILASLRPSSPTSVETTTASSFQYQSNGFQPAFHGFVPAAEYEAILAATMTELSQGFPSPTAAPIKKPTQLSWMSRKNTTKRATSPTSLLNQQLSAALNKPQEDSVLLQGKSLQDGSCYFSDDANGIPRFHDLIKTIRKELSAGQHPTHLPLLPMRITAPLQQPPMQQPVLETQQIQTTEWKPMQLSTFPMPSMSK